ncbi:hypothetical protein AJ80_00597 [Polytolypa hystricis UAMH7299]|uniref:Putative zinc-finger domain-containing protein n=1 Tax=Polytolypa hystricis (strain UAMH7299) TaxID=1447883 RepID=A0A2B7Z3I3_POLH7|nr:hypothetical protein AJ80_00597 [Polytolypa hystricis UAMH7299]
MSPFGGHHNLMPPWPVPPPSDTAHMYPLGQPPFPPQPPHYASNASSFHANGQIPGLSANTNGFPPPPPHLAFDPQFQNSQYPIPPRAFSPFPPRQPEHHGGYYDQSAGFTGKSSAVEAEPSAQVDEGDDHEQMDYEDKEEGELSNGEVDIGTSGSDEARPFRKAQGYRKSSGSKYASCNVDDNRRPVDDHAQDSSPHTSGSSFVNTPEQAEAGEVLLGKPRRTESSHLTRQEPPSANDKDYQKKVPSRIPTERSDTETAVHHGSRVDSFQEVPNGSPSHISSGKSPAQLRIQAQGALLSLAPLNIRFKEFVEEGIDPNILKRLYDDIGVKVTPTVPSSGIQHNDRIPNEQSPSEQTSQPTSGTPSPIDAAGPKTGQKPLGSPSTSTGDKAVPVQGVPVTSSIKPSATQQPITETSKPLERKDVIARMLAAKAKKAPSTAKGSEKPVLQALEQPTIAPDATTTVSFTGAPTPELSQQSIQATSKPKTKGKNKAQTELARQRIEQLKRQGLPRSQSRPTVEQTSSLTTQPLEAKDSAGEVSSLNSLPHVQEPSLQYPLPTRPPESEFTGPRIPGLFMTGSVEPAAVDETPITLATSDDVAKVDEQPSPKGRVTRKRPRASDFVDEPITVPSKRQHEPDFKTSADHRVVIDISDDEMMYDSDSNARGDELLPKSTNLPQNRSTSRQPMVRDIAPLSDFPPKGHSSRRPTPATSASQTSIKGKEQFDLEMKNMEILALRRKIAERERQQRERQALVDTPSEGRSEPSGTPSVERSASENEQPTVVTEQREVISNTDRLDTNAVGDAISLNHVTASPVQSPRRRSTVSRASLDPTKLEEIRQKIIRKQEIEFGLPALEAELQKSQAKLAEFREQEKRLMAEIAKGEAGKRRLVEELEALGFETEGLSLEQLQATKDRLSDELTGSDKSPGELSSNASFPFAPSLPTASAEQKLPQMPETHYLVRLSFLATVDHSPDEPMMDHAPHPVHDSPKSVIHVDHVLETSLHTSIGHNQMPETATLPQTSQEAIEMRALSHEIAENSHIHDGTASDGISCSSSAMDESTGSIESPFENDRLPEMSTDAKSAQGSEPVAPEDNQPIPSTEATLPSSQPAEVDVDQLMSELPDVEAALQDRESSVGSDAYEPPEPEPVVDTSEAPYTPPFSPAPAESVEPMIIDIPSLPPAQNAQALTLNNQDLSNKVTQQAVEETTKHHFTPYVSPLKLFKAYRYHPNYTDEVDGGYRSLTYSNHIDPHMDLCVYEVAGGVCNDNSCDYQHFRDMNLSDDKILIEMGSQREGKTTEEKDSYVAGLKQTIDDMRRDKVKDFNTVATEIAAYRRRFLQDPSRVLAL